MNLITKLGIDTVLVGGAGTAAFVVTGEGMLAVLAAMAASYFTDPIKARFNL